VRIEGKKRAGGSLKGTGGQGALHWKEGRILPEIPGMAYR